MEINQIKKIDTSKLFSEDMYTPIELIRGELESRWDSRFLKDQVQDFLGEKIPDFLEDSPKACLARHIATPNNEFFRFKLLSSQLGLKSVISEFLDDKFAPENKLKYHLGNICITDCETTEDENHNNSESKMIIDFNKCNGKKIRDLKTIHENLLVDFHHALINPHSEDIHIHDFSEWIKRYGRTADKFYVYFLAFFLRNGVLFENFQITPEEKDFTIKNVLPAFKTLVEIFGLKPLVVKLLPGETADHKHWVSYSKKNIENT